MKSCDAPASTAIGGGRTACRGTQASCRGPAGGFTLIELLVVVAIIALLISILLPSLQAAREQAKRLKCATNIRSFATASQAYAHDHDGYVPRDYAAGEHNRLDVPGNTPHVLIPEVLSPYLGGPAHPIIPRGQDSSNSSRDLWMAYTFSKIKALQCPSFPPLPGGRTAQVYDPAAGRGVVLTEQPYDYVCNAFDHDLERQTGSPFSKGITKLEKIPTPQNIFYILEAYQDLEIDYFGAHDLLRPWEELWWGSRTRMIDDNRHRGVKGRSRYGYMNALFFDGHGESMPVQNVSVRHFSPYSDPDVWGPDPGQLLP